MSARYTYTLTLRPASNNTDYRTVTMEADRHTENDVLYMEFFIGTEMVGSYRNVAGWHRTENTLPDPSDF